MIITADLSLVPDWITVFHKHLPTPQNRTLNGCDFLSEDVKVVQVLPEQLELAKQLAEKQKKDARRQWWKNNWISVIALLEATASLIMSILK